MRASSPQLSACRVRAARHGSVCSRCPSCVRLCYARMAHRRWKALECKRSFSVPVHITNDIIRSLSPPAAPKTCLQMMGFVNLQRQLGCVSADNNSVVRGATDRIMCSSAECASGLFGDYQTANLGDGHGDVARDMGFVETPQSRMAIGCSVLDLNGVHSSVYRQDGANHPTGALFLACVV